MAIMDYATSQIQTRALKKAREGTLPSGVPGERERRYDAMLDAVPAAIYTIDGAGKITFFNEAAAALWGCRPTLGETAWCGSWRLYWPDGRPLPHEQCPIAEVLRTGTVARNQEIVIERPDGTRLVALANIDPLKDSAGTTVGAVNCLQDITERKRLEAELRKSRDEFEDFFENAVAAMHLVGADGTILRANKAELELLGYAPDEYVGRHIAEFHFDRITIDEILMRLARGEALDKYPARLRAKDGTIKHVQISSNVYFRDGKFAHTRCVTIDVTAQKKLEAALRESERRFRELFGALPAAIYTTDANGRITYYNRAAADLAGREPTLGSDEWCVTWKLYWPDGRPLSHDECPMAVALKEKRPVRNIEAVAERPDGTRVPFLPFPTPLFDEAGELVDAVNMLLDLTDQKRLGHAERRLAAIVESSDDAVVSMNLHGHVTTWNAGAERLYGFTAAEIVGKPISMLIPADRRGEELEILKRILTGERVDHYETVRRRKDDSLVEISLSASPIKDELGRIIGASKIARDITERRRAQERQKLLLREMNHRVKNLFTLAGGVVALSARSARTPQELATNAQKRLAALARAHQLTLPVLGEDESQPSPPTTLPTLVHAIVSPFIDQEGGDERIGIAGPPVPIGSTTLTSVALLAHELATNAAKYGALSVPEGRVTVEWSVEQDRLLLIWREQGGPAVEKPPVAEGFGSVAMRLAVTAQLEGEIVRDWNRGGLVVRLSVPLARLAT